MSANQTEFPRNMKILIFNWRCWLNPEAGGAEIFTKEVAKRWVRNGNDVTLFVAEFQGCEREEVVDGVRIVRAGGRYSVYREAKKYYEKLFSAEGYDVIVDEINTRPFLSPKFICPGEKIVALIHQLAREYWYYETPFPMSYIGYYFLEKRWLRNYVNVPTVTVSESTKQDLLDLGFREVFVVSEGLNFRPLSEVPKKESHPIVIYVGRLKKAKRPDHAVRAFRLVKKKIPRAELWIIGDGYFIKDLKKIAGDDVKFFSGLNDHERRELVTRSWVLVNPSVREGWGLNVIEANALGVPAVAYDVAGLRCSVKDHETGLHAKAGSIEDLAEKIVGILNDETLRQNLSKNALEYSRKFSWDKCTAQFSKILNDVTTR